MRTVSPICPGLAGHFCAIPGIGLIAARFTTHVPRACPGHALT